MGGKGSIQSGHRASGRIPQDRNILVFFFLFFGFFFNEIHYLILK